MARRRANLGCNKQQAYARRLSFESLEARCLLAAEPYVTVLEHGFNIAGDNIGPLGIFGNLFNPIDDYWTTQKVTALLQRFGGGRVYVHDPDSGTLNRDNRFNSLDNPNYAVIVDDWAKASNDPESGQAEAAADALFSALVNYGYATPANPTGSSQFDFIGHSRGASVVSEVVQRLGTYGIPVDYVTYLDPHDFNEFKVPQDELFHDPAVQVWNNVLYADNFWEDNSIPFEPTGRSLGHLPGESYLYDHELTEAEAPGLGDGPGLRHGQVIDWYFGTVVPGTERTDRYHDGLGADTGFNRWFTLGGFNYNGAINGIVNPANPHTLVDLIPYEGTGTDLDDDYAPITFFTGNFELHDLDAGAILGSNSSIAGWAYFGGGGTAFVGGTDANHYLSFNKNNDYRTHDPMYIPDTAVALQFDLQRTNKSDDDYLEVSVGSLSLGTVSLSDTDGSFKTGYFYIPEAARNKVDTFTFRIVSPVGDVNSAVHIDNIRLSTTLPPPIANPGGPYTVAEGGTVQLNGATSTSAHPTGGDIEYWWDLDGDGVFGETSSFAERGYERGAHPTFRSWSTDDGRNGVQVQIGLRLVASGVDSTPVYTTVNIVNAPPEALITGPSTVSAGTQVTYNALYADPSSDDAAHLSGFNWLATVGGTTYAATGPSFTFTPAANQQFDVQFTLSDDDGGTTTATKVINLSPSVPATLDGRLDTNISASGEIDVYAFTGQAGRELTVSAYWGQWGASGTYGAGLLGSGRVRLIGPDGTVLASPANNNNGVYYADYYSQLANYVLPENGTYYVEVVNTGQGTGNYWLGISDPLPNFVTLPLSGSTSASFGTQGDWQEYQFTLTAGQTAAWTYQGSRSLEHWEIYNPSGQVISSGVNTANIQTFTVTAATGGIYRLVFEDVKSNPYQAGNVGPFNYTLSAAATAPLNQRIDANISASNEADLYAFTGQAGRELTVSAYWGYYYYGSTGLAYSGRFRLIGPDGTVLASPSNNSTSNNYYSQLANYVLPQDGIYYVEVVGGSGNYSIGISDPLSNFTTLPLSGSTSASFGTQGDWQEYQFTLTAGQTAAWTYQGDRPLEHWEIYNPSGQVVTSGTNAPNIQTFVVTAATSGTYKLVFEDVKSNPYQASNVGPFNYTLSAATTAPLNQRIDTNISASNEADLYAFTGQAGREVTVSASWGYWNYGSDGVWTYGRFRLIGPDGTVLATPSNTSVYNNYYSQLANYVLPQDGIYYVEVENTGQGTGNYSIGITDPLSNFTTLPLSGATHSSFGIQGDWQEYQFALTAGQSAAWTYQGSEQLEHWEIYNPSGQVVTSGTNAANIQTFAVTAATSGTYKLVFEDAKFTPYQSSYIGPFNYTLSAAMTAPLNQRIDANISATNEADLYAFTGQAGREVTISASWGYWNFGGDGIWAYGRFRLIGPDGTVLASPSNNNTGSYYYSQLANYVLPQDGTYYVEVVGAGVTGNYWLGISDPLPNYATLPLSGVTNSSIGTQGDWQEYQFALTAGQTAAWTYQGSRSLEHWEIYNPSGQVISSGVNTANIQTFAVTAATSGTYKLVFEDAKSSPYPAGNVGPFNYTLSAVDTDIDGISDALESALGDGNGDGIPDANQSNVASLPNAVSGSYLTIAANNVLHDVAAALPTNLSSLQNFVSFVEGVLDFRLTGLTSGSSTSVDFILHSANIPTSYYKFGPTPGNATPHWYEFLFDGVTGAEINGNHVTLHFIDGQRGDDDLSANGIIVDAGGPTFAGVAGDYDRNGHVQGSDYTAWRSNYGTNVSPGAGADGSANGIVDAADYVLWRKNLGASAISAAGSSILTSSAALALETTVTPDPVVGAATLLQVPSEREPSDPLAAIEFPFDAPRTQMMAPSSVNYDTNVTQSPVVTAGARDKVSESGHYNNLLLMAEHRVSDPRPGELESEYFSDRKHRNLNDEHCAIDTAIANVDDWRLVASATGPTRRRASLIS